VVDSTTFVNPQPGLPPNRTSVLGKALAQRAVVTAEERDQRQVSSANLLDLTRSDVTLAPAHVRQAARDALARGETHYTVRPGVTELRAAIGVRSTADGFPADADTIVITNGGSEALYILFQGTVKAGDRIAIAGPVAPNIQTMLQFIGASVVRLDSSPTDVPDDVAILLLTDPSPISGIAAERGDFQQLVSAAIERRVTVILDRSAANCRYDGQSTTFANAELGARVLTIGSFSAGYGLGGWRVGWFSAPPSQMGVLRELKQAMSICTTAVSQFAALAALEGPSDWLEERRNQYCRRRDLAVELLNGVGLQVVQPDAWPGLLIASSAIAADDVEAQRLLAEEHGVLVDAGSQFGPGTAGFIRIDLGAPGPTLREALDRIADIGKRGRA